MPGRNAILQQVRLLMPWLPEALVQLYTDYYIEYGESDLAWAAVRQSDEYDQWLPGNVREDGSLRMTELEYFSTVEGFENVFLSFNLNPRLFREEIAQLIGGDVSVREFEAERLDPLYQRVLSGSRSLRQYYAKFTGLENMSIEAMVASVLKPQLSDAIINQQITMAEIGAAAHDRGFDINRRFAKSLFQQGIGGSQAKDVFGAAAEQLPILDVLARRHADPDDDFDIEEFTAAVVMDDPIQRQRIRRLMAAEQSSFANIGAQTQYKRDDLRGGRYITGLVE